MNKLKNVQIKPLEQSIYLTPLTMQYTQNDVNKRWDLVKIQDGVAILIYNKSRDKLVFVKQFRPPVYYCSVPEAGRSHNPGDGVIDVDKYPAELGLTLELCAGIVDKDLSLAQIAKEEVLEECGYDIPVTILERISACRSAVGVAGCLLTMYYCEVTDEMRVSQGGGVSDEIIDVVEMTVAEVREYMAKEQVPSPASFMYAMYWFLHNKCK